MVEARYWFYALPSMQQYQNGEVGKRKFKSYALLESSQRQMEKGLFVVLCIIGKSAVQWIISLGILC